jgi:hypothetical protein
VATLSHAPQGIAASLDELASSSRITAARVWNPQLWGSWLEWAVPQACYATDSRIELFPAAVWTDASTVSRGDGDWLAVLGGHGAGAIVLTTEERPGLEPALAASPDWTLHHEDADGAIWTRRPPTIITGSEGCPFP